MRYGCVIAPQQIGAAIAAGFDYIELPARALEPEGRHALALRSISRALARSHRPVKVEVFSGLLPEDLSIVGPAVDRERLRRYLHRAFTAMWALGGVLVVLGVGPSRRVPDGFSRERATAQFAEALAFIAEEADRNGLDLVLDPLNRAETNLLVRLDDCRRFLADHGLTEVRLLAGSYHLLAEDESPTAIETCASLIAHTHIADSDRLPPGQGEFDFAPFFGALRGIGYDARISHKCLWRDFEREAGPARAFVQRQWEISGAYVAP
jgi:D-psicose/D-tagatose/L-ribulose 3-epimerase